MGQLGQVLVVMTNGDVYYISKSDAEELTKEHNYPQFKAYDTKSRKNITIFLAHISSIVEEA